MFCIKTANAKNANQWGRSSDFTNVDVSIGIPETGGFVSWNLSISKDRYSNWYISPFGIGINKTTGTNGSASVTWNWIDQPKKPTENEMVDFLTGSSMTIGGGNIVGGSVTISPEHGPAYGVGFFTPQAGGSYNWTPSWLKF